MIDTSCLRTGLGIEGSAAGEVKLITGLVFYNNGSFNNVGRTPQPQTQTWMPQSYSPEVVQFLTAISCSERDEMGSFGAGIDNRHELVVYVIELLQSHLIRRWE